MRQRLVSYQTGRVLSIHFFKIFVPAQINPPSGNILPTDFSNKRSSNHCSRSIPETQIRVFNKKIWKALSYLLSIFYVCISHAHNERRRRDLNPRAAINDLLPFQGSPFSHLGTSPKLNCINIMIL